MSSVRIQLAPKAGFCIKSASLAAGVLPQAQKVEKNVLEPIPSAIPIPVHTKIFVNIAWDPHVPPPPEGSEDAIREAMQGEDVGEENEKGWYVPVIVSPGREDKDKCALHHISQHHSDIITLLPAGNTAIVFDCIYNSSLKSRTLTDPEFKIFLVGMLAKLSFSALISILHQSTELALQRIEAQSGLTLSRSIGTPNIASKGKLLPRTVHVPASLLSGSRSKVFDKVEGAKREPLIQEVFGEHAPVTQPIQPSPVAPPPKDQSRKSAVSGEKDTLPGLRGILKKGSTKSSTSRPSDEKPLLRVDARAPLQWTWSKDESGKLVMDVQVPALVIASLSLSIFR